MRIKVVLSFFVALTINFQILSAQATVKEKPLSQIEAIKTSLNLTDEQAVKFESEWISYRSAMVTVRQNRALNQAERTQAYELSRSEYP